MMEYQTAIADVKLETQTWQPYPHGCLAIDLSEAERSSNMDVRWLLLILESALFLVYRLSSIGAKNFYSHKLICDVIQCQLRVNKKAYYFGEHSLEYGFSLNAFMKPQGTSQKQFQFNRRNYICTF